MTRAELDLERKASAKRREKTDNRSLAYSLLCNDFRTRSGEKTPGLWSSTVAELRKRADERFDGLSEDRRDAIVKAALALQIEARKNRRKAS